MMKRKRYLKSVLLVLGATLMLTIFCPVKLTISETHIQKMLKHANVDSDVIAQGCYHTQWDAPTGMNSSGEYWGFRAGNWLLQLDISTGDS